MSPRVLIIATAALLAVSIAAYNAATESREPPHVVFLIGESEYGAHRTIGKFAQELETRHGFKTTILRSAGKEGDSAEELALPDLADLEKADLLVLFLRFRHASDEQLAQLHRRTRLPSGEPWSIRAVQSAERVARGLR